MERWDINVFSEIGKLKTVLLHRPGEEVENLTPDLLERLLFDDIPFLKVAQQEHDAFAKILKDNGVEVLYVEKLVAEALDTEPNLKKQFLNDFLDEAGIKNKDHRQKLHDYLIVMSTQDMVNTMIAGVETAKIGVKNENGYPFVCDPLPNILFQRDPFASIFDGICLNNMYSVTRNRETLFSHYFFNYHPKFEGVRFFYDRKDKEIIEGGDIMVLNENTLIIGASQRTKMPAIELLAKRVIEHTDNQNLKVVALDLPNTRAFMHLDTVMSNVDHDKFVVHPLIFDFEDKFKIFEITKDGKKQINMSLEDYLSELIGKKATLIRCGGDSPIAAGREQWNDGTNVLTIKPGLVIAYSRNHVTNKLLRDAGVTVLETPSSELSRGRGGPRCMSMPLIREAL